jgi:hypothetical protein
MKPKYRPFFWPLNLVPLVFADDLAEIARLEAKLHITQDDAARGLARGLSSDIEEIRALAEDDTLHPGQRLQAVRRGYARWAREWAEADAIERPAMYAIGPKVYTVMPGGIR